MGDSESVRESYDMAFKVGVVGSIILGLGALLGDTLAGLAALVIWSIIIPFLPRLYTLYCDKVLHFPKWFIRGPHQ